MNDKECDDEFLYLISDKFINEKPDQISQDNLTIILVFFVLNQKGFLHLYIRKQIILAKSIINCKKLDRSFWFFLTYNTAICIQSFKKWNKLCRYSKQSKLKIVK